MEHIKRHIENYGFKVNQINHQNTNGYYCKNNISRSEFILDFSQDNLNQIDILCAKYNAIYKIKVVFLIHVNNNVDKIIELVQKVENEDNEYLIFDKSEDIEFFLKDLWNIIIKIKPITICS